MPLLIFCLFTDLLGFGIIIPLLPFMALRLEASPQDVTLLVATYSFALLFAAPLWGRVSDRIGRKPVLLLSFLGTGTAFLVMAFADALWMLFLARAIAGMMSGDIAAAPAYVSDITTPERRARAMGLIGAAFGLAFCIGPGIGAYLVGSEATPEDFRNLPLISAALSFLTFLVALIFLPESRKKGDAEAKTSAPLGAGLRQGLAALHFPYLGLIAGIIFLVGYSFSTMESTIALWSEAILDWGPREVGYLFVYAGAVAVVFQGFLVGPLSHRFGEAWLVVASAFLLGLGLALVGIAEALPLLLVAVACLAAGFGLGNPALQSLVSRLSRADSTGGALGLGQAASSLSRVCGPPVAGFFFELYGPATPYAFGAFVMVIVLWLAVLLRRGLRRDSLL